MIWSLSNGDKQSQAESTPKKTPGTEKLWKLPVQILIKWSESGQVSGKEFELEMSARVRHMREIVGERTVTLENSLSGADDIIIEISNPAEEDSG